MFVLLFILYCICIGIGVAFMGSLWIEVYFPYLDKQKKDNTSTRLIKGMIYKFCFISFIMIILGFFSPVIYVIEKYNY